MITPWMRCDDCGKIVRVNKPLVGSMHLCLREEERLAKRAYEVRLQQQAQCNASTEQR